MDKLEIVGRSVVLRKSTPYAPHQAAHREIETWRAVLPLVITVRREFHNLRGLDVVSENMRRCPVNLCITQAALLVVKTGLISDARQNQPVPDAPGRLSISREPRD